MSRLFLRLGAVGRGVLMLDYDGTLAPFRRERMAAVPYAGVSEALAAIAADGRTRLVVVSGRPIAEVLALLPLALATEIWGAHGWEHRLPDGTLHSPAPDPACRAALDDALAWLLRHELGARGEDKGHSVACHWRGLAPAEVARVEALVRTGWAPLAEASGLRLHPFDGGLELHIPGRDKGWAVRAILDGEAADGAAAYLGDDRTDEDAFLALAGRGLGVLVRDDVRPTQAAAWLRPPGELLDFLARWRRALAR